MTCTHATLHVRQVLHRKMFPTCARLTNDVHVDISILHHGEVLKQGIGLMPRVQPVSDVKLQSAVRITHITSIRLECTVRNVSQI